MPLPYSSERLAGHPGRRLRHAASRRVAAVATGAASERSFRRLWAASTVADFGGHVSSLALPLTAIAVLDATPFGMGLLAATSWVPYVVLGLFAGLLVDRVSRRSVMLATDCLRAGLLLVIPCLYLAGQLTFGWLIAIAFASGACGLLFHVAQASILPGLVDRSHLADANGRLEATNATAQASGPAIAGVLIGVVSAPLALIVNAVAFLGSAALLRAVPVDRSPGDDATTPPVPVNRSLRAVVDVARTDIGEGIGFLVRARLVGATIVSSLGLELFGFVFLAVYLLFMSRDLGLSGLTIGLILSLGGVGAILGALVADRLRRRLGFGATMIWSMTACGVTGMMVPLAVVIPGAAIPLLAAAELLQYGALAVFNIGARTLRQALTPGHLLGRVSSTARMADGLAIVGGSLLGGVLGGLIGLGPTLVVGSVGMLLAIPPLLVGGLGSMTELPDHPSADPPGDGQGDAHRGVR